MKVSGLILLVLLFIPKVSLISIKDYSQGIRVEDILLGIYLLYKIIEDYRLIKISKFMLICFAYLLVIMLISFNIGIQQQWIILVRLAEYFIIYDLCTNLIENKYFCQKTLIIFILVNSFIAILQYFSLLGAFSSSEYINAGHGWLKRPYGLTGGPWELGFMLVLCLCGLYILRYRNFLVFLSLNILTFFILAICGTRANIAALILYYFCTISVIKNGKTILFSFIFSIIFLYIFIDQFIDLQSIFRLNFVSTLFKCYLDGIGSYASFEDFLINSDMSLYERFLHWRNQYFLWNASNFSRFFGIGFNFLYMESLPLRALFCAGIIGLILCAVYVLQLPIFLSIVLLCGGLTLDLFISAKITTLFILVCLLLKVSSTTYSSKTLCQK